MSVKLEAFARLTANGTRTIDLQGKFGWRFGLLVTGNDGGGSLAITAGDSIAQETPQIQDPIDGTFAGIAPITGVGLFMFEALCERLDFVLTGSTTPTLDLTLFMDPRP